MTIIVGGHEFETPFPSKNWIDTGMAFTPGHGGRLSGPKQVINKALLHFTGGEGNAKGLFAVLQSRDLGCEFGIESDGTVVQFADPVFVDCWHGGIVNPTSWGVEVINGGIPSLAKKDRGTQKTVIHGRSLEIANFYPAQVASLRGLLEIVNGALGIPMKFPQDEAGMLLTTVMDPRELALFSGVLGHFHVTTSKIDPGVQIFWDLEHAGLVWER